MERPWQIMIDAQLMGHMARDPSPPSFTVGTCLSRSSQGPTAARLLPSRRTCTRVRCRPPRPAGRPLLGRSARPRRRRGGPISGALTPPGASPNTGDAAGTRPITVVTSMALLIGEDHQGLATASTLRWGLLLSEPRRWLAAAGWSQGVF